MKKWLPILIIFSAQLFFAPTLFSFFSGDDWFHLDIIRINSLPEFLNFFSSLPTAQSATHFRPLPTQVFFFIFYQLFGLNAFPYFLFWWLLFGISAWLFYKLLINNKFSNRTALIALVIYCFSQTNFVRLNFLSAGQEIMMSFFILLALLNNKSLLKQVIFWCLALLSKETAIIGLGLFMCLDLWQEKKLNNLLIKKYWFKYSLLVAVGIIYLIARFCLFGTNAVAGSTYVLSFSPKLTLLSTYFYSLWTLGAPELIQDYLSSPIILIPKFWTDYGVMGKTMIGLLITNLIWLGIVIARTLWRHRNCWKTLLIMGMMFAVTLLPFLFFYQHRFAISLSLPVMVFGLFMGLFLKEKSKLVLVITLLFYLSLNTVSYHLTSRSHYSVQRAKISRTVFNYLQQNQIELKNSQVICIKNGNTVGSDIATWGSSRQIANALWHEHFWNVYFQQKIKVEYEDLIENFCTEADGELELSAETFLN
jgi:hypothetical protein